MKIAGAREPVVGSLENPRQSERVVRSEEGNGEYYTNSGQYISWQLLLDSCSTDERERDGELKIVLTEYRRLVEFTTVRDVSRDRLQECDGFFVVL